MLNVFFLMLPLAFIGLGYLIGSTREKNHLRALDLREATLKDIVVTDLKTIPDPGSVSNSQLVMGEAVMASDYFKSIASQLRNLVGGELKSLETLCARARREAVCRMLEQARELGAAEVHNVRLETSNIVSRGGRSKSISAEMFAYGTAIIRRSPA